MRRIPLLLLLAVVLFAAPAVAIVNDAELDSNLGGPAKPALRALPAAEGGLRLDVAALTAWESAPARAAGGEASWNEATGLARAILMPVPAAKRAEPLGDAEAERLARAFLAGNAAAFGLAGSLETLKLERIRRDGIHADVRFVQIAAGLPVADAGVVVNLAGDAVVMATSTFAPAAASAGRTRAKEIPVARAVRIAKRDLAPKKLRAEIMTETVLSARGEVAGVAHIVRIPSADPLGDFEYLIDAKDGRILSVTDCMDHAGKPDATGLAYPTNPIRGGIERVPLTSMKTGTTLEGKWVKVINEDGPGATETDGTFDYELGDTHFEEVGVYYYFNIIHDYFKDNYGFADLDFPFPVYVHYGDNYDNAFFSPWQMIIALGDGTKLNNLAREESVSMHEYVHAVTHKMCNLRNGEAGAMNEAFSDYFPCSITDDPDIGEWAMAKLGKPYMRRLENTSRYPEDIVNEVHRDSPIYSGSLWDLRKAVGAKTADALAHYSRKYMPPSNAKFVDGLKATLAADRAHFAGRNEKAILDAFRAHGIVLKQEPQDLPAARSMLKARALSGDAAAARALTTLDLEAGE